jgi:acyl transferase domain-containing protein
MLHAADQPSSVLASFASRVFGFKGPSLAVDTHSASSMTALHMACLALGAGDCDRAIAGGVAYLRPEMYLTACRLGLLGDDRRSRSLSENRNGAIFADGVGAVLLKRLSDAVDAGDEILAVIRSTVSSYVGNIGLSNLPAPELIERTIRENFIRARVNPRTIGHLETAAAGYKLADPLEIQATTQAFRSFTSDRHFCTLGSLKRNIGHATAASGVHQLIKVILQIRHGQAAPFFDVDSLDPNIDLKDSPFHVHSMVRAWERSDFENSADHQSHPRRAMINSLGYGGFYAGAILEEYR